MNKSKLPTEWNLKLLFESDEDPKIQAQQKEIEAKAYEFINKWNPSIYSGQAPSTSSGQGHRDDYLKDPKVLKEALDEYEIWGRNYNTDGDFGFYFFLRQCQDEADTKLKAKNNQIQDFSTKLSNDIQFFEIRLAKVSKAMQTKFLSAPELVEYKHFLEILFKQADHILTESEEKIINLYSPMAASNWMRMLSTFISKSSRKVLGEDGKKTEKNFEEIMSLIDSKKKPVRDEAAKALNNILSGYVDVAEAEFNSVLQTKKVSDDLRGFARPDAGRHLSDDIDSESVDALLEAVKADFNISQRYYQLKAKLLGVKKLKYHERNIPYGKVDKKVAYPEAVEIVGNSLNKLDPEFKQIFDMFVNEGHIDVFPKQGKTGGGFCAHNLLHQPTYILLNYTGSLRDVTTLAHEVGHGINDELIAKSQNALNAGISLATAEVASTFMEDFAMAEMTKKIDPETQLALNMGKLNDDISTVFRQIAAYLFEQELHAEFRKEGYLSKDQIGKLFLKHMVAYMGDAVEQSAGSENWWVYWSHLRNSFYVYSYSSGLLISKSLQHSVRQNPKFISKVKEFLSAGKSATPREIFANLDVDITDKNFWLQGLREIERLLTQTEKLASDLGKV